MMRVWIGLALLAGSWLFGLSYYETANLWLWAATVLLGTVLLGTVLLGAGRPAAPLRRPSCVQSLVTLLLLLSVAALTPWPYRAAPAAIILGLLVGLVRKPTAAIAGRTADACITAGLVLLVQAVFLTAYAAVTARSHDLPAVVAQALAGLAALLGVDASADGPSLVLHTLRQTHRLAVTWGLVFDPATGCFLLGGLTMLAIRARAGDAPGRQLAAWAAAAWRLALIVLAWLPIRTAILLALYLHRAARSDVDLPLHVMNQFLSAWVHLGMLVIPALAAWRWVLGENGTEGKAEEKNKQAGEETDGTPGDESPAPKKGIWLAARRMVPAGCWLLTAALLAVGLQWAPSGTRKQGRVTWVERHSTWSPTTTPYDTKTFGGDDRDSASYNYALVYDYLDQFYTMSRVGEQDPIDDDTLNRCDVLIVKIPTARYSQDEVDAVVRFVRAGGGILFIGDHTNLDKSSAYMNDVARNFGFTFRDDVLYGIEAAPDEYRYTRAGVPHPAMQHVGQFDFAVSCSVDPGMSRGRPLVEGVGLWSMPSEYHNSNFMPLAQHLPEMRYGAFVQAWATAYGRGRAAAWADSTIFSNFCVFQPGKADVMVNLVEWLDHENPVFDWAWLPLALGLAGLALIAWLARVFLVVGRGDWLLLVAATACGWCVGSECVAALHGHGLPMPQAVRPKPRVVIDRTTSQVPLAQGAFNENKQGQGYAMLEQAIPRLGYTTARAADADAFSGDALVVICPTRPASQAYCDQLRRYVADGGRLLVIDSSEATAASTANQLLRPFGLAVQYQQNWEGWLVLVNRWPWLHLDHAWEVTGGQRVAALGNERAVAAQARYGKGLVMAVGFGSLLNDAHLGDAWWHYPDDTERLRYEILFSLLRTLVEDKAATVPAATARPADIKLPAASLRRHPSPSHGSK